MSYKLTEHGVNTLMALMDKLRYSEVEEEIFATGGSFTFDVRPYDTRIEVSYYKDRVAPDVDYDGRVGYEVVDYRVDFNEYCWSAVDDSRRPTLTDEDKLLLETIIQRAEVFDDYIVESYIDSLV